MSDLTEPEFTQSRSTADDPFGELPWNWGHRINREESAVDVAEQERSMYDRLGPAAIREAVDEFYTLVLADRALAPWFAHLTGSGQVRLARHQAQMIGQGLGGPVFYELDELRAVHQALRPPITDAAYDAMCGYLLAVLGRMEVPADIAEHLTRTLVDIRPLIVGQTDAG